MTSPPLPAGARSLLQGLEHPGQMNLTDVEQRANAQHPGRGSELLSNLEAVGLIKVIGLAPHTQLVQITDAGRHALAADQPEPSVRRGRIWCTFGYAWVDIRSIWLRHVPEHQRYWFRAASGCGVLMAAMIGAAAALAAAGKAPALTIIAAAIAAASGAAAVTFFVLGVRQVRFPFASIQALGTGGETDT